MPRGVAVAAVVLGLAVAGSGALAGRDRTPAPADRAHTPRLELEPAGDLPDDAPDGVHGVVVRHPGEPASGVKVVLVPLFSEGERLTARTDARGRFAFEGVEVTPGTPYIADAAYDGASFGSGVLRFGRGPNDPVRIVVAPTTAEDDDLLVDVESIALIGDESGMQAVHALTLRNTGDRAYTGGLRLSLLPGANAIDPRTGLDRRRLTLEDAEMRSSAPVPPGRTEITYTYLLPARRDGAEITHRPRYPTRRFELLLGGELDATALEGLEAAGSVELGPRDAQRDYRRFAATDPRTGRPLTARVVTGAGGFPWTTAGVAAAAVAAAALVLLPILRRRRTSAEDAAPDDGAIPGRDDAVEGAVDR